MLQKEVAMRLVAQPGNKTYGRLSVVTALDLDCESLFDVSPESFDPPPKVVSTVLRIIPKTERLVVLNRDNFNALVSAAFSQRRKKVRNSLKAFVQPRLLEKLNIDPTSRAENLTPAQYISLADAIS